MDRKKEKSLEEVVREKGRYDVEAYRFVFEGLDYLLHKLGERRHVTGAELAHAIRELALERFGLLAKTVLNQWGVHETHDFGEIVYHLVENGLMSKTDEDRISDFDDIYDFEEAFDRGYHPPSWKIRHDTDGEE
ncbi:MAG: hypothetical protein AMK75_06140 [Planctomycetes bacterium SM23_65]|nr:MAG: hypothetical protein AMK75_06140 [Planctomycetes bacterium SM23_65]